MEQRYTYCIILLINAFKNLASTLPMGRLLSFSKVSLMKSTQHQELNCLDEGLLICIFQYQYHMYLDICAISSKDLRVIYKQAEGTYTAHSLLTLNQTLYRLCTQELAGKSPLLIVNVYDHGYISGFF